MTWAAADLLSQPRWLARGAPGRVLRALACAVLGRLRALLGPHDPVGVAAQRVRLHRQRRARGLVDGLAVRVARGAYRDVARVASRPALGLGEADGDEAPLLGHEVEVRHALGLGIVVVQEPRLALEVRRVVSVQGLVAVQHDPPLVVDQLERRERDAIHHLRDLGPVPAPPGAEEHNGAARHRPVLGLPRQHVLRLRLVRRVRLHLVRHVHHHERAHGEGGGDVGHRRAVLVPVRGRVELRADLVRVELVRRRHEAVLEVGEGLVERGEGGQVLAGPRGAHGAGLEAGPQGDAGREGVGEVYVFGAAEGGVIHAPEA
mmetsp:Transcript_20365/g.69318  ORF Transcript_20365/g.69318 Transcript_20365/m.69318 type:complete len:318 (-) Transcript_20365:349-1302(-)